MYDVDNIFEDPGFKSLLSEIRFKLESINSYRIYYSVNMEESDNALWNEKDRNLSEKMFKDVKEIRKDNGNTIKVLSEIENIISNYHRNTRLDKIFDVEAKWVNNKYKNDRRFNYSKIREILANIIWELSGEVYSDDEIVMQLAWRQNIMESIYPNTYSFFQLIDISGLKNMAVENENHGQGKGFGYHIHFLQKNKRTNTIFLFNNKEENDRYLYWEKHNETTASIKFDPRTIADKKKKIIYSTCLKFKKFWRDFRDLSAKKSEMFY